MNSLMRAAAYAALVFSAGMANAQDVTLTSRNGALSFSGTLLSFDGEFYRVDTSYGALTVDADGVLCDGPACPDLTAPKATIRIVGPDAATNPVLPLLIAAFAKAQGLALSEPAAQGDMTVLTDPQSGKVLAEFGLATLPPDAAREALVAGRAELLLSAFAEPGLGSRSVGLDALVAIVSPDNPLPSISTTDLARALEGKVSNWAEVGGPDMPLVLHGLQTDTDLQRALSARLGRDIAANLRHPEARSLWDAVAKDPWALAVAGKAAAGAARVLPLTDSCGFPLLPTPLAVKAEDYPLALPLYLLTPPRRLPLMAREFLEFLATPAAQEAVEAAGYVGRRPQRQPMTADGLRLINAIQGAGEETTLEDLKRLVDLMDGSDRLSLTFRFEDGTIDLDPHSRDNLADLARLIGAGQFKGETLYLAGFSDGRGQSAANLDLSRDRAIRVLMALRDALPDLPEEALPKVVAFGEALPMACDETGAGRRLNRRVELWLRPDFVTDTPPNGN